MKKDLFRKGMLPAVARFVLGFAFLTFGLDGFLHFIPIPPARPAAEEFIHAIIKTNYFFQMVKSIEIFAGTMLVCNRFVPVALTLLAPLLVGISSIHIFLNPEGIPLVGALALLHIYLLRTYWNYFQPLFRM